MQNCIKNIKKENIEAIKQKKKDKTRRFFKCICKQYKTLQDSITTLCALYTLLIAINIYEDHYKCNKLLYWQLNKEIAHILYFLYLY